MTQDASVDPTPDVLATSPLTLAADEQVPLAATPPTPAEALPIGTAEPRTRWAGIVWGLVLAGVAGFGIWFSIFRFGLDWLVPWAMTLTPFTLGVYIVLGIAALAVVAALVGLIRHAQKTFAARRARS